MSSERLSTAVTGYLTALKNKIMRASGPAFHGLFLDNDEGKFSFVAEPLVSRKVIVNNEDDLNYAKTTLQSGEYIFNSWQRISRGAYSDGDSLGRTPTDSDVRYSDKALPNEMESFTYDPATDKISSTIDSHSLLGFVSPEAFDTYVFDVHITSTSDWQNDEIGLLLGYARDADGTSHTLTLTIHLKGGVARRVMVDYATFNPVVVAGTSEGLSWADGSDATAGNPTPPDGVNTYEMSPWGENPNGVRMRVTRNGDDYTVETTDYNGTVFVPEATFSFNLNDHPSLERFKGPTPYGYVTRSQDLVNWDALQRPGNAPTVFDVRTGTKHSWDGSRWSTVSFELDDEVKKGRLYFNDSNGKVFYRTHAGVVKQLLSV